MSVKSIQAQEYVESLGYSTIEEALADGVEVDYV